MKHLLKNRHYSVFQALAYRQVEKEFLLLKLGVVGFNPKTIENCILGTSASDDAFTLEYFGFNIIVCELDAVESYRQFYMDDSAKASRKHTLVCL